MIPCPKCSRQNADDALYCDQCRTGVSPALEGASLAEPCPACGGKVKEVPSTAAMCSDCGIFMGDAGGGACAAGHHEPAAGVKQPAAPAAASEAGPTEPCPVCALDNPVSADRCGDCGIYFEASRALRDCPCCEGKSDEDKCRCGAILTLPKLLGYVDDGAKVVCLGCKQLFMVARDVCSDCSSDTVPADGLKKAAAARR